MAWYPHIIAVEPGSNKTWSNISSMGRSVLSVDETLRRELKIRHAVEYFWRTSRYFICWWNTVLNAWYYFLNKVILEEIKDAKMSSFSPDFQHSLNINFLCIFFMNYQWDWRHKINMAEESVDVLAKLRQYRKTKCTIYCKKNVLVSLYVTMLIF